MVIKILLTGATGYIGGAVARTLAERGHEVLALARSEEAESLLKQRGYSPIRADITDAAHVASLARNADAFVHAANTQGPDNAAADAAMTSAVLKALEGTGKAFVYTSGLWALGATGEAPADESSPVDPIALTAWRAPIERDVLAAAERGVRSIVIRPAIVHGAAGGIPAMLVAEAKTRGSVRMVGGGGNEWPGVHIEDLADLYALAVEKAAAGQVLHGVAGSSYPLRDVALAASIAGGAGGARVHWSLDDARRELGAFADALALHQRVSSARTRSSLGWDPRRPSVIEELLVGSYS